MLPSLVETSTVSELYQQYLAAIAAAGFRGEIGPDYATRTALATDNSIYQILPQAVVFPCDEADVQILTRLADSAAFEQIVLSPRGGGTGTNGQSLTDGIVVDLSRHMNRILEINAKEGWARVQTGVVKDQLNQALKEHGLFFAPELSTSNRATIGGMINTDASGQGSVQYGKTRDHVLSMRTVLGDGEVLVTEPIDEIALTDACATKNRSGQVHRTVRAIWDLHEKTIKSTFPPLNRCLTGYDLAHIRDDQDRFNLNNILCGSEGTLGFITEAKLNVLPIPKTSALVNVFYDKFEASLRDARSLMAQNPTSIETVDDIVLELAKSDIIWHSVADYFPDSAGDIRGVNLVEYTADSEAALESDLSKIEAHLQSSQGAAGQCTGYTIARGTSEVNKIWGMRKRAVGLLGNAQGEARPIPFVEDTAVPPENLADFIMAFRAILDKHQLRYGMFGHVDCGVLHVRPALDMKDSQQASMVREISEQVVALVRQHGGLLWGEHGKGVRSEFSPEFFGELYPALQAVKAAFDPRNQFNPGKLATPDADSELLKIDGVTTRGELDRTIPVRMWDQYNTGMYCNGNGACHNWNPDDYMCPSWKATRDRRQSPKGRASLVREWLHQLSARGISSIELTEQARSQNFLLSLPGKTLRTLRRQPDDFNQEIHDSFMGCLACKSCSGQCPIKVDVPTFRAQFLEVYYSRYLRPLKDYFIGGLEFVVPWFAKARPIYNLPMQARPVKAVLSRVAGMVDSPLIHRTDLKKALRQRGIPLATVHTLSRLDDKTRARSVILVQDAFTSYFDTDTVLDVLDSLRAAGVNPLVMPFLPNGKPLHVHGFHNAFAKAARKQSLWLRGLSAYDVPFMGVDPSMVLAFRSEYRQLLGDNAVPDVHLPQEFLANFLEQHPLKNPVAAADTDNTYYLLGHCTESTNAAASIKQWQAVYAAAGLRLEVLSVGCCGMSGTFGHETRNRQTSETLYDLSWRSRVENPEYQNRLVASGYSCRSQAQRFSGVDLPHPLSVLKNTLNN